MLEIIKMMNEDEMISAHLYSNHTEYLGDCVLYDFYTIHQDKKVQKIRLQITIIAEKVSKVVEMENRINGLLLTLGDNSLTNNILQVEQNGGGSLFDENRRKYHRYLYYDIIKRGVIEND